MGVNERSDDREKKGREQNQKWVCGDQSVLIHLFQLPAVSQVRLFVLKPVAPAATAIFAAVVEVLTRLSRETLVQRLHAPRMPRRDGLQAPRNTLNSTAGCGWADPPRTTQNPEDFMTTAASASAASHDLGPMPVWDLSDLYTAPNAPEVARDLARAERDAQTLKEQCQGKLAEIAKDGDKLGGAIKAYEDLSDLMGKLASYAGLYYYANQADPERAKFLGDTTKP